MRLSFLSYCGIQRDAPLPPQAAAPHHWELCISVKRNDVFRLFQSSVLSGNKRKLLPCAAAEKRIQLRKLPTLAFITHPDMVAGI